MYGSFDIWQNSSTLDVWPNGRCRLGQEDEAMSTDLPIPTACTAEKLGNNWLIYGHYLRQGKAPIVQLEQGRLFYDQHHLKDYL